MTRADYDEISRVYDDVREADVRLIDHFLQHLPSEEALGILDIGCGTGNYTDLFQRITQACGFRIHGNDPSEGMLTKARQKNPLVVFRQGTAGQIPWKDDLFDFVYMTDVIHHVPDTQKMFAEIHRVTVSRGRVCIVTQSHRQIEARPIVRFFPGTARVDTDRYPDIGAIIKAAQDNSLACVKEEVLFEGEEVELGPDYLERVRKKGYSMLSLLEDREYELGLRALEGALREEPIKAQMAGETLIWFTKE